MKTIVAALMLSSLLAFAQGNPLGVFVAGPLEAGQPSGQAVVPPTATVVQTPIIVQAQPLYAVPSPAYYGSPDVIYFGSPGGYCGNYYSGYPTYYGGGGYGYHPRVIYFGRGESYYRGYQFNRCR
jgi:hypothetical protein